MTPYSPFYYSDPVPVISNISTAPFKNASFFNDCHIYGASSPLIHSYFSLISISSSPFTLLKDEASSVQQVLDLPRSFSFWVYSSTFRPSCVCLQSTLEYLGSFTHTRHSRFDIFLLFHDSS